MCSCHRSCCLNSADPPADTATDPPAHTATDPAADSVADTAAYLISYGSAQHPRAQLLPNTRAVRRPHIGPNAPVRGTHLGTKPGPHAGAYPVARVLADGPPAPRRTAAPTAPSQQPSSSRCWSCLRSLDSWCTCAGPAASTRVAMMTTKAAPRAVGTGTGARSDAAPSR